jgi:hypothetical protein
MNSGTVTKIVDSCRHPVMMAGEACRASSGGRARGYAGGPGARQRRAARDDRHMGKLPGIQARLQIPHGFILSLPLRADRRAAETQVSHDATCQGGKSRRKCGGRFHLRMAPDRGFCPTAPIRVGAHQGRSTLLHTGDKDVLASRFVRCSCDQSLASLTLQATWRHACTRSACE